jgi:hypothetical protein
MFQQMNLLNLNSLMKEELIWKIKSCFLLNKISPLCAKIFWHSLFSPNCSVSSSQVDGIRCNSRNDWPWIRFIFNIKMNRFHLLRDRCVWRRPAKWINIWRASFNRRSYWRLVSRKTYKICWQNRDDLVGTNFDILFKFKILCFNTLSNSFLKYLSSKFKCSRTPLT